MSYLLITFYSLHQISIMRHHIVLSLALGLMAAGTSKADEVLKSPDGDIALTFEIRDGRPTYFVDFKGKQVIAPSGLGFDLSLSLIHI